MPLFYHSLSSFTPPAGVENFTYSPLLFMLITECSIIHLLSLLVVVVLPGNVVLVSTRDILMNLLSALPQNKNILVDGATGKSQSIVE